MNSEFSTSANEVPWIIRADFTDVGGWEEVVRDVTVDPLEPDRVAQVDFMVADRAELAGLTPQRLLDLEPHPHNSYFIVDHRTLSHPEHPLLAVDVRVDPGSSFRLIPSEVQSFAANMLIANMDFDDFADNVDPDGIFRGFDPHPWPGGPPVGSPDLALGAAVEDVLREADPHDPESFVGELIRTGFWNPAAWQRLEAGMRAVCRRYEGAEQVPRVLTEAFHSVTVRVPNLVALPGFIAMMPGAVEVRLERIRVLGGWFFRGWSTQRPDAPLAGEYDPDAQHG